MELIRVENLYKTYHLGEIDVPVLKGVSFSIQRGEMVALMGASGSGKTTLMNILGCLDRPSDGEYWLDGQAMSQLTPDERALVRTAKLGFVFQSFNLLARTSALHNVLMPLDYLPNRPSLVESRHRAEELLARVGLATRLDHEPSQMSGGQQQRVAIARSLVNQPALILADEPTGNLDSHTSVEILQMFRRLNASGITVILVTHDQKVASYTDRVIRIADGMIESDGAAGPPPLPHQQGDAHVAGNGRDAEHSNGQNGAASANGDSHDGSNGHAVYAASGTSTADVHGSPHSASSGHADPTWQQAATGGAAVATAVRPAPPPILAPSQPDDEAPAAAKLHHHHTSFLHVLWDLLPTTLRTALGAMRRNKMRSGLTALGIVIGIAAVIAMVNIGQGSKKQIQQTIASMGANNLLVQSGAAASGGITFGLGSSLTLTPSDADEIRQQCPAVVDVAPVVRARGQLQVVYGNNNWNPFFAIGTTPSYLTVRDWEGLAEGDMFTDRDVVAGAKVCVLGQTLVRELFHGLSPVGKEVRLQNVSLRVVGVLSRKGANTAGMDQDDTILAPWTTMKYRISGSGGVATASSGSSSANDSVNTLNKQYPGSTPLYPSVSATQAANTPMAVRFTNVDSIQVLAASSEDIPDAITQITGLLHERHHIRPGQGDDFNIRDLTEFSNASASLSDLMGGLLMYVALISLVVGGVGIMNIMLVSVTERTREIGLRMAVGARSHHILKQFLIEAIVLCMFGGAIGILTGLLFTGLVGGMTINFFGRVLRIGMFWPVEVSVLIMFAAVLVSVTVGIAFGFYPAWKASRLDPIEALRYE